MWVDRAGAKIALQETYSRNSKGSLGLVLERVRPTPPSGRFILILTIRLTPKSRCCV